MTLSKFNEEFVKNYNENGDIGYTFKVDVTYPINIRMQRGDLTFFQH